MSTALVCFSTAPRRTEKQSRSMGARAAAPQRLSARPWVTEATVGSVGSRGPRDHTVANHSPLARQGHRVLLPLPLLSRLRAAEAAQSRPGYRLDLHPRTNRRRSPKRAPTELQSASLHCISSVLSVLPKLRRVDLDTVSTSAPGRTGDGHQNEHPRSCKEHCSTASPQPPPCCRSCAEPTWIPSRPPPPGEPATVIKTSTHGVARSVAPPLLLSLLRAAEAAQSQLGYRLDLRLRANRQRSSKRAPTESQGASPTS